MSPQAMYFWPKNGQNGQNKNFPRHNTAIKWFKATVPRFWPSFRQIWCADSKKMCENLIFWLKMVKNGKNWPFLAKILKTRIFLKIRLEIFFSFIKIQLCAKNHQNLMRGFLDMEWDERTDGRTNGRTDGRAWIHRPQRLKPRDQKGSKMVPIFCQNKNFHWPFLNNKLSSNKKN